MSDSDAPESATADGSPDFPDSDDAHVLEADCARCPALVESRTRIAWGNGPADADVIVVGEAPAAGDPEADRWQGGNHTGLAYTSRHSGRRIRRLFAAIGYADRTYYTNAVKCFPRAAVEGDNGDDGGESCDGGGDADPTNREPTAAELTACRDHLRTEIERVDPAVVVPTGKHATASLLAGEDREIDGFLDLVLERLPLPSMGTDAVPILHPSYQEVWLARLGYDEAEYRASLADQLPE